jgi:hypothetical protein
MRVAMLVGFLMLRVVAGLYEGGAALNQSAHVSLPEVKAMEDVPPPPNWP